MIALFRAKLLHFCVLGLVLYGLNARYLEYQQRELLCPSAGQIALLESDWLKQNRQPLTPKVRHAIKHNALDEQMLIREAQLQGLHKRDEVVIQRLARDADFLGIDGSRASQIDAVLAMGLLDTDEVIRRRLIQIQELQVAAAVADQLPSEQDLQRIYTNKPSLSQLAPRYSFQQRLFAGHDIEQKAMAEQALARLIAGDEASLGDVFLSGTSFNTLTSTEINAIFGAGFWPDSSGASQLDQWFGPRRSVFGWHLIKLHAHRAGSKKTLAEVRPELEGAWRREQQGRAWQAYLATLRGQYRVVCHNEV